MTQFPDLLKKLHQLDFDYADGDGINFLSHTKISYHLKKQQDF